jgi:hypothetical protein
MYTLTTSECELRTTRHSTKFVLTIGPVLCAIHPSAWNWRSPNFAGKEFSEVRLDRVSENSVNERKLIYTSLGFFRR